MAAHVLAHVTTAELPAFMYPAVCDGLWPDDGSAATFIEFPVIYITDCLAVDVRRI